MPGVEDAALATGVVLLVVGFAYAAFADLRDREVTDALWQGLGIAGFGLGFVTVMAGGAVPVVVWTAVGALTLEHMFAWDERLGPKLARFADLIELVAYALVIVLVGITLVRVGFGTSGVPPIALAVLVSVVFARILFEVGVLYGGADAKALMIASLLVPIFSNPLLVSGRTATRIVAVFPFSIDLLMNAALLSVTIPIVITIRNVVRGDFSLSRGFTGYRLAVAELPRHYVWVRDSAYPSARDLEHEVETSDEDRALRTRIARELAANGVREVWVTPQIPFLVLMAVGAFAALLAGNLVIDLIQWL